MWVLDSVKEIKRITVMLGTTDPGVVVLGQGHKAASGLGKVSAVFLGSGLLRNDLRGVSSLALNRNSLQLQR